jgi:hypothetical protein
VPLESSAAAVDTIHDSDEADMASAGGISERNLIGGAAADPRRCALNGGIKDAR